MCRPRFLARTRGTWLMSAAMAVVLLLGACGGSSSATDSSELATDAVEATATPAPTATDVPIATSVPPATPTPLPTTTPVPLQEPTPSTVLLTTAFTNSSRVTTVGIDEVFFGMTPEEAAEAASTEWIGELSSGASCYRVTPANGPDRVSLWVVDGRMERLDVEHPDIRTRSRLGVGNSVAELQSQLGDRLTVEDFEAGVQVATFTPSDSGDNEFRMIFELVDDAVVRYRSGRVGIVQRPVETC